MTSVLDPAVADPGELDHLEPDQPADGADGDDRGQSAEGTEPRPKVAYLVAAAAMSSAGAAWLVGGLFRGGMTPRLIALLGVVIGVGLSAVAFRLRRSEPLQYAVLPVALVAGAIVTAPAATGGTANLPGLVGDALRSGGLLQPPVPFEPGWRFLLVVLLAMFSSAAVSASTSLGRPSLAVAIPAPLTVAAALIQPEGSELLASVVGALFTVGALALSYGASLADSGAASTAFETRRLGRGLLLLLALVGGMVGISRADFLFPDTDRDEVIPPQRPPVPPPEPDRVLFRAESALPGPWRVGTLDSYDGEAFLLPPLDPARLEAVETGKPLVPLAGRDTYEVIFEIVDVRNRALPVPSEPLVIEGTETNLEYDPRTQTVVARDGRPREGVRYSVVAASPPDGKQLAAAPPPDPAIASEFGVVPPPPNAVVQLLDAAPDNPFDRLQFVRQALYNRVVASGAGRPVEVTPARAAELLDDGAEASPFEITATEVLLARWAGIPARMGFGFFGGEAVDGGREFRPKHGAAFLEAYFEGSGWVAIVGTPPRAKDSITDDERNEDPQVVATDELGMVLYIPVRLQPLELIYQTVRYWAFRVVPLLLLLAAAFACHPAALKTLRSSRRRRWAGANGVPGRIWVAYCELRDKAYDLNVGDVRHTPVAFVGDFVPDAEHGELAWLVTRAMWGDLRRDVDELDAEAAEEMARSVRQRIAAEQPILNRFLAGISRTSLRDPYSDDVPNVWLTPDLRGRVTRPIRNAATRTGRRLRSLWPGRVAPAAASLIVVAALFIGGCAPAERGLDGASTALSFPEPLMPAKVFDLELVREGEVEVEYADAGDDALVDEGRVFTIHDGSVVQGSVQIARFKPEVDARNRSLQNSVEKSLGERGFSTRRFGVVRLRELQLAEQRLLLWFPPEHNVMVTFVLRAEFDRADAFVEAVLAHQLELPGPAPEEVNR